MVSYRLAATADFVEIAKLHTRSWQENYRGSYSDYFLDHEVYQDRTAVWEKRLTSPAANQFTIVAEKDGKLIGFVCAFLDADPQYGTLIDNLHVSKEAKGKGIGKELIRKVASKSAENNPLSKVYLWVLEANVNAFEFYVHFGAAHVETARADDIGDTAVSVCRMVWETPENLIASQKS
ncbi:GNAT family N-acetyltransferase [Arenibacter sp. GZD96]|uniref:GNAT family N-acetyltransferase n=1 Tax=Aurantibrevibacter litoralis TaxID=3106030 RepID=UPI002AFF3845|nr:GNAT family N-acetyltransferase [Arenibacter sp. GZD-96]MEA1784476.1 GNAT family N-acetyltransferase [Arenibacter sp. GZD-96]